MDSISTARDFFINQQGLSPDQADMIVSQGLQAYNQQTQPRSMMQMASGGIARLGYQMGGSPMGVGTMPMDYGQSLQVSQQMPTNFSSAQSITSNPLLNYGQPQLGTAGGTPLSMNRGGIARLGYQMGGEAMMQPQMGSEMSMPQMNEQQALETIIQLLIEQGVDPETALKLAAQILQIFAQGGEPAVEAFANQLEQQEQAEAMASGGIAGYGYRQGYGFGGIGKIFKGAAKAVSGVVKGVASAVKSVAKSPIGRIALTIGANMLLPGAGTAFGAALQSAAVNLGIQAIGGGKINPLEALAAGASGYFGYTPSATGGETMYTDYSDKLMNQYADVGLKNPTTTPLINNQALKSITTNPLTDTGGELAYTNYGDNLSRINETFSDRIGDTFSNVKTGIQNLSKDPLGTIKNLGTSALNYAKKEPGTALAIAGGVGLAGGLGLGSLAGPKRDDETDDEYSQRLQKASPYLRQYYTNLNPGATPGQIEQFVTQNTSEYRAGGGIIGYAKGGSMVPPARQIEGGIIELDARKTGGYIPYGKKERVDDVPAMLAKDEFVFTSRAVKAAGGGSAKRGAAKMYALMKQLESKGKKMERGARA